MSLRLQKFVTIPLIILFFLGLIFSPVFLILRESLAAGVNTSIIVTTTVCGNGTIESGEQCDGLSLAGETCISRGYTAGNLSCNANCTFNTSGCTSGGGGGGGGGGVYIPPPETAVYFSGRAYPLSKVGILKDVQLAITTIAGPDAIFNISLKGLSSGSYIFSVFGEDNEGRRSVLFTFPVFITQGATTHISGIFIAPTIAVDKKEVKLGDNIAIFGQSVPEGEITVTVNSEKQFLNKVKTDKDGVYLLNFDTSPLKIGEHFTKSKTSLNGEISSFSETLDFIVGTKTVLAEQVKGPAPSDLNGDGRVNIIDFSIAAYWYKKPSPPAVFDLNGDNKVDLVDFSIIMYWWTG